MLCLAAAAPGRAQDELLNELKAVNSVRLVGARSVGQREIRKLLKTRAEAFWPWSRAPALRLDFLRADTAAIALLYRHRGFLEARADYSVSTSRRRDQVDVTFHIHEGQRSRIASVALEGADHLAVEPLLKKLWARRGRPFDPAFLQLDTLLISAAFQEAGFRPHTRAVFTREDGSVHVRYQVIEGPRYRFGDTYVSGLVRVREYLVRRELLLPRGETYRASRVQQSAERLYDSGLFDRVQISSIPDSTTRSVFFDVLVHERRPRWIDAGLGTGTTERFRFTASWGHRNLNLRGLQGALSYLLALDGEGRFLLSRPEAALLSPWLLGLRVPARLSAYYEEKDDRTDTLWVLNQRTQGVALELRRDLNRLTKLLLTQNNSFVRQSLHFHAEADSATRDSARRSAPTRYRTHRLQLTLDRDTRNHPLLPTRGWRQNVTSQIAGGPLKGQSSFHKHLAEIRWFRPLRGEVVLATRLRGGIIRPFGESRFSPDIAADQEVRRVPVEDLFRLGGASSIRGFEENDITAGGPGGLAMLLGNAEVRFPIWRLLHGEGYVDAGNVWARPEYVDMSDFRPLVSDRRLSDQDVRLVAGVGVSLQLPVGALRSDWTWALRHPPGADRIVGRWQFAIGPLF